MAFSSRRIRPYSKKDLAWTQWTAADIHARVPRIIAHVKMQYATIKKIPHSARTFENTVYAIESALYAYADDIQYISVLFEASPEKTVRDAAKDALTLLDKKLVDIEHDPGMYRAFMEYAAMHKKRSAPEDEKLMRDMETAYRRMGFDLPVSKQKEVKRILKEISKLSTEFSNNINAYNDHIAVTREELEGLPKAYIDGLKQDTRGRYLVSLSYPELVPFLSNARSAKRREELTRKNLKRGGAKNIAPLKKILALRHTHAKLLGYRHHADFRLEVRMAKDAKTVRRFLDELIADVSPAMRRDHAALLHAKEKETGRKERVLHAHDPMYYIEQTKKHAFHIESEVVREYFPLTKVLSGTFTMYQKLFGVTFTEMHGYPLWHTDVRMFSVSEKGNVIGYFFLDLFSREGKYSHACVTPLSKGREHADGSYQAPSAVMLANFPRPGKTPTLLSHGEVEMLFHEFGHVMHNILTTAKYYSQSGTSVKRDFVEAPSQMFEYWAWNEKTLTLLSGHYKTGKPLPHAMVKNMLAAKRHMQGYAITRQLTFASFDLAIHSGVLKKDIVRIYNELVWKLQRVQMPSDALFPAGFGHLVGYDAGYYGYLWSKVYGDDMFTKFRSGGMLNARVGREYRDRILAMGSSREEMDLVKGFLGRSPNNAAFVRELGLA